MVQMKVFMITKVSSMMRLTAISTAGVAFTLWIVLGSAYAQGTQGVLPPSVRSPHPSTQNPAVLVTLEKLKQWI